jgi:hypothetical protein
MENNLENNLENTVDPWELDKERIIEENQKKPSNLTKVNWLSLPKGNADSAWRILPFRKKRTFFVKVQKHWGIDGIAKSITCPRSFDIPGLKLRCAICEERWKLFKSKKPEDNAVAKEVLKMNTSYYVNAYSTDFETEKGLGVLNIPYGVWQVLFDWLTMTPQPGRPHFGSFSHPTRGFDIIIKSSIVPGAHIPGSPDKEKRNHTVTPLPSSPIKDMALLDKLYDLDTILGIPSYELTLQTLERVLSNDPTACTLPEGTALYLQLGDGAKPEEQTNGDQPPPDYPANNTDFNFGENESTAIPAFARKVTPPAPAVSDVATTQVGADGHRLCFGRVQALDESNETCLECPEINECEGVVVQAKRAARSVRPAATGSVTTNLPLSAQITSIETADDMEAKMRQILNTGKK